MTKSSFKVTSNRRSYPYNRAQECSWQPEEVSRALSSLYTSSALGGDSQDLDNDGILVETSAQHTSLISQGLPSERVPFYRVNFGRNQMDSENEDGSQSYGCTLISGLKDQLKEPLNAMLLVSACLSLALGNLADAVSIIIALTIVCLVAAVQEYRSEQALEALNSLVPHTCTCMRDGRLLTIEASEVVVGDLIVLSTGDRVPADVRLVDSVELALDESSLTGENTPVHKTSLALTNVLGARTKLSIADQSNVAFMGTLVSGGRARALVVAVGSKTEFGKISEELSDIEERKSPLQVKIDELGNMLAKYSSIAIIIMALIGFVNGSPFLETVTISVSLAVAAIPEGLPICVTVTLALGVLRMAGRNAIVKKLPVVESLGCATIVASDKTGTLTKNEMTARTIYTPAYPHHKFRFTGIGYDLIDGKLILKGDKSNESLEKDRPEFEVLLPIFGVGSLCNNASYVASKHNGSGFSEISKSGQPTELALLVANAKARCEDIRSLYHRMQEIPFSSGRKRMEVQARPLNGVHTCRAFLSTSMALTKEKGAPMFFIKGMPEALIGECIYYTSPDGTPDRMEDYDRQQALSNARIMSSEGLRVLAMAYGTSLEEMVFAGLVGMEDPPREGVMEAVKSLRSGGVTTVMVTGDSKETAFSIARRCGIFGDNDSMSDAEYGAACALSGEDIDSIPARNLANSIGGVKLFYRVSPRHKLALVRAFQQHGEVVAMTGDGVNDATALKVWLSYRFR